MCEWKYPENELIKKIGVHKRLAREIRKGFEQGMDWEYEGGKVCYSKKGAHRLLGELKADPAVLTHIDNPSPSAGAAGPSATGKKIKWLVYRKTFLNVKLCQAEDPDTGEMCRVVIQPSDNWVKGMKMKCRHEREDVWTHCGRRPRYRGRY